MLGLSRRKRIDPEAIQEELDQLAKLFKDVVDMTSANREFLRSSYAQLRVVAADLQRVRVQVQVKGKGRNRRLPRRYESLLGLTNAADLVLVGLGFGPILSTASMAIVKIYGAVWGNRQLAVDGMPRRMM